MVLKDLVAALDPREMRIDAHSTCEGITTTVRTRYPDRTS